MSMDEGTRSEADRRAMEFLRQARTLRGLARGAEARIERAIEAARVARRRPRPFVFAAAAAALALMVGGAFALAHVGWRGLPLVGRFWGTTEPRPVGTPPSRPIPPEMDQHRVLAPRAPASGVSVPVPEPAAAIAPAPAAPGAARSEPKRHALPRSVAVRSREDGSASQARAVEAPADALAESRSFGEALERWHRQHDSAGALTALDAHERRFPAGRLVPEARLLRAEILLAQGRERESLQLLDRVQLDGSPRSRELLTVRGELRVKAGRCDDARADLNEVVRKGSEDGFAKRATQALGHCR